MGRQVGEQFKPARVVLFGSYAYGTPSEDSDIDLLIIEQEPFGGNRKRWPEIKKIRRMLAPFRLPKDILVFSRHEVEKWKNTKNHIIATCLREGKVLYERP